MHPNSAFRRPDRGLLCSLIDEIGFASVFAQTPDGPRVAQVPLLRQGEGAVRFHLARGNALTRHLDGATALAVLTGPDGYVSPRWYADQGQVPTWNYVALELEGRVRKLGAEELRDQVAALSAQHEARIPGEPWTLAKTPPATLDKLLGAIVGFELEIAAWRETFKLSQNKPAEERERVAAGLEGQGQGALAHLVRSLGE